MWSKVRTYLHEHISQAGNYPRDQEGWIFKDPSKGHLAEKKFLKQSLQNLFNVRGEREVRKRVLISYFNSLFIEVWCLENKVCLIRYELGRTFIPKKLKWMYFGLIW